MRRIGFELASILALRPILDRLITGDTAASVHCVAFEYTVFGIAADAADKENAFSVRELCQR